VTATPLQMTNAMPCLARGLKNFANESAID
jgi:hypothetical protein